MSQIEKGFEAKYGIKTEYWRADATKVIDRVLTEWRSGKPGFDLVIGARGPLNLGKRMASMPNLRRRARQIFRQSSKTKTANWWHGALRRWGFFTTPSW